MQINHTSNYTQSVIYTGNRWYESNTFMNSGCGSTKCPAQCNTSWEIISNDRQEWNINHEFHIDCKGVYTCIS